MTASNRTGLAAVDLASNSFKLVVAEEVDGALRHVDRLRERVALAEGLKEGLRLDREVVERALGSLDR